MAFHWRIIYLIIFFSNFKKLTSATYTPKFIRFIRRPPIEEIYFRGKNFTLPCVASGNPSFRYKWIKNDELFDPNVDDRYTQVPNEGSLVFSNPNENDEGIYQCVAYNEMGEISTKTNLKLALATKPTWVKIPVDQTVVINESVTFECEGNGDPEPITVWLANGKPIQHYLDGVRRKMEGNKIVVENVTLNDNAVFQCNISNLFGYIYTNGYLNVIRMVNNTLNPESREYGSVGPNPNAPPERPGKTWQQLEKLNSGIDDQNRILTEIRNHLKEFVNVFKKASFMKNESDD